MEAPNRGADRGREQPIRTPKARWLLGAAAVIGVLDLFAAAAVALSVPFLGTKPAVDLPVTRYIGLEDGQGNLMVRTLPDGTVEWESQVVEVLPGLKALQLPGLFSDAVAELLGGEGATTNDLLDRRSLLDDARVAQTVTRLRAADGSTTSDAAIQVLDDRGLFLLGFTGGTGTGTRIDPPIPVLPADPEVGAELHQTGEFGALAYTWDARVARQGRETSELGTFDDCLVVESDLTLEDPGSGASETQ